VSLDENYSSVYSQYYNLPEGAYVKYVESGSAAAKAGIAAGDIITKVDSKSISSYSDLTSAVKQYHSGDTATITLYRSGKTMTVTITFDEAKATSSSSSGSTAQSGSGSTQSGGSSSGSSGFGSGSGSISLPQQGSSNSGSYYNFG
jgi:C-terminal processing protease CtpA/Prc